MAVPLRCLAFLLLFSIAFQPAESSPRHGSGQAAGPSATITGVITDPDGRPAPGARALVVQPVAVAATATTDTSGRFRITDLAPGSYELRVALEGFRAAPVAFTIAGGETREVSVGLRLGAVSESVVVTAAQVEVPLTRAPGSVTVIASEDLRARQMENVADALRGVPGLSVTRSGGRGALTSVFPRGGESDYTLVFVDGVRVNAFGGGFDFAHLPAAEVERIEVARGPQSALFGADAIGAAIQIVTRHGGTPRVEGTVEGGAFGTARGSVASAGAIGRWGWGAAAERLITDGFRGIAPATGERVSNDDHTRTAGSVSTSWRARATEIRADARLDRAERGFPGPFGSNPKGVFSGVDRISRGATDTRTLSLAGSRLIGARARIRAHVTDADIDGEFTSPFDVSVNGTRRRAGRGQIDLTLTPTFGLTAGAEAFGEQGRSTYIVDASGAQVPVRRRVAGYFGEVRYAPHATLSLTAGLRLERIHRHRLVADPYVERPEFPADTVVSINPKVAAAWRVPGGSASRWTQVRAGAGTGIRPPDAFEIAFTDNPGLKPERSRSVEAGVEQGALDGALVLEATAFSNHYDDLLVSVGGDYRRASRFKTDNIANARARGIEAAATARASHALRLRATYTYVDTAVLAVDRAPGVAPAPFAVGDPLIRRPAHRGAIDAVFTHRRVTGFAQIGARGRVLDVEPSYGAVYGGVFHSPGYAVTDAGVSVRAGRWLDVFGRVTNVLDRSYEEALGFPALGRAAMIGVRVAARR